ncbi:hypothetical protein BgiBS90_011962, partial [Biomphalaria glabrata]
SCVCSQVNGLMNAWSLGFLHKQILFWIACDVHCTGQCMMVLSSFTLRNFT